jgi:acetyltransferase-like isoleucine patch superfamily enzyme
VENFGVGRITIGEESYVGDDCLLSSATGIDVGARVLMAHGVQIFDNDSHPVDADSRRRDYRAVRSGGLREPVSMQPVRIGDDAWVGFGAVILKGVEIGRGAVVAAGSVVASDVPEGTVVAGNPARVVKIIGDAIS